MNTSRSFPLFVLLLALSGCNGSGNSGNLIEVPFLQDDQFTAATATVQTLDVLANDVDSGGGALTIVSVQGSGQVVLNVVGGNRIEYQPACCSITSDQFTYTVQNTEGRRATATVRVDVQRRIQLTLRAPALTSIATAAVFVGTATVPVTISGNTATATIDLRTDALLVRAELGQSARLVLVSALGSVPQLVSRTPPSGRLDADILATLEVSPFTTSLAGTLTARTADTATVFDARLAALTDWEGVTRRAQYLAAVLAAGESALPATGTLYDLAANTIQAELLIENTTLASGTRAALFPASAQGAVATAGGTFWFYRGGTHVDELAYKLELTSNGSGTLVGPRGAIPVAWNVQQNALNVAPAGPAGSTPTLLTTGLITRRGGACEFNVPRIFERADRVSVNSLRLASFPYSAPSAATAPEAWIASVTGTKVSGFTLSGCQPIIADADAGPSFPFEIRAGALIPVAPLALNPGHWVLPFFGDASAGRPLPQIAADVLALGVGVAPGGNSLSWSPEPDGSIVLMWSGLGSMRIHAIARFGDVYRVVVESQRTSGERRVDEAWLAKFTGGSPGFAEALENVRLRSCCRIAALRILRFDAQGQAFWELTSGGLVPAEVAIAEPRGTLTIGLSVLEDDELVIDPVALLPDGRFLTFSNFVGQPTGGAEVITLEPVSP